MSTRYVPRLLDTIIPGLLQEIPALFLAGPRAAGKTTTARKYARSVVQLDQPGQMSAFQADPDAVLRGLEEPVLLDEWQVVPGVLGAVKRAIDEDPRPGRYLVTGSVQAGFDAALWPGTGRLVRLTMFGLNMRELEGKTSRPSVLDRLEEDLPEPLSAPADTPDLRGYLEMAFRGGYPEPALRLSPQAASRWFESYVDHLVTRDVGQLDREADPVRLRRYIEAVSLNTAGVVDQKTLYEGARVNKKTARAYDEMLDRLFFAEELPAWWSNRVKRLVKGSKRFVLDAGVAAAVARVDINGVLRDGDLLGRMLETFVMSQLRAEAVVSTSRTRLFHLRQEQGRHEVDIIIEFGGGRIVAIEVKADAAPRRDAWRHLVWLRDHLGDRFIAGILLHTGPHVYTVDHRIVAAPIASLWS